MTREASTAVVAEREDDRPSGCREEGARSDESSLPPRTAGVAPRHHLRTVPRPPGSAGDGNPSNPPAGTARRYLGAGKMGSRPQRGEAERALMRAVLEDAIRCLAGDVRPLTKQARLAVKARKWVLTRDACWPYSFDNICHGLNLDPDRVRARLMGPREVLKTVCTRVTRAVLAP